MVVALRHRWMWTTLASGACAAVPYVLAVRLTEPHPTSGPRLLLAVLGGVLTLLAVALPAVEQRRYQASAVNSAEAADHARRLLRATVNTALNPILAHIAKMAVGPERRRIVLRSQLVPMVLNAMIRLIDVRDARACWFELEQSDARRLLPALHQGRAQPPTTVFDERWSDGKAVFAVLDRGEARMCRDLLREPPEGWVPRTRGYRCFIAVPVRTDRSLIGMLTLDCPEPDALTGDEVPMMHLMASLLAGALAGAGAGHELMIDLDEAGGQQIRPRGAENHGPG